MPAPHVTPTSIHRWTRLQTAGSALAVVGTFGDLASCGVGITHNAGWFSLFSVLLIIGLAMLIAGRFLQ